MIGGLTTNMVHYTFWLTTSFQRRPFFISWLLLLRGIALNCPDQFNKSKACSLMILLIRSGKTSLKYHPRSSVLGAFQAMGDCALCQSSSRCSGSQHHISGAYQADGQGSAVPWKHGRSRIQNSSSELTAIVVGAFIEDFSKSLFEITGVIEHFLDFLN